MRRLTLWILGSSIVLATGLFQLKHQVVRMEDELLRIIHEINEEKKHLHMSATQPICKNLLKNTYRVGSLCSPHNLDL